MNLGYLNDRITLSRIPITAIAEGLGLSRQSLYLKMQGKRDFKTSEVYKLCDILRLTEEEKMLVFFAEKVDKNGNLTADTTPASVRQGLNSRAEGTSNDKERSYQAERGRARKIAPLYSRYRR